MPTLADLTAKATILFLLAWLVATLMRRASAASRHLVWTSALGATLLLPIARLTLPAVAAFELPDSWSSRAVAGTPSAPLVTAPPNDATTSAVAGATPELVPRPSVPKSRHPDPVAGPNGRTRRSCSQSGSSAWVRCWPAARRERLAFGGCGADRAGPMTRNC